MLVLCATPIGNLGDASPRLRETLAAASVIACEDTRTTRRLLDLLGVETTARLTPLHEHNERSAASDLVSLAEGDELVALVSDAGMPGISDPGFRVVELARERGVAVSVVPGPVAAVSALAISGLPTDRFTFEGFLPRRAGERASRLRDLATEPRTMTFYEAPHRAADTLAAMAEAFGGDRAACVARELTKLHEEIVRGTLRELVDWAASGVRGELVIVVAGAPQASSSLPDAVAEVRARRDAGERLKEAAAAVAEATGLSRRELYEGALRAG